MALLIFSCAGVALFQGLLGRRQPRGHVFVVSIYIYIFTSCVRVMFTRRRSGSCSYVASCFFCLRRCLCFLQTSRFLLLGRRRLCSSVGLIHYFAKRASERRCHRRSLRRFIVGVSAHHRNAGEPSALVAIANASTTTRCLALNLSANASTTTRCPVIVRTGSAAIGSFKSFRVFNISFRMVMLMMVHSEAAKCCVLGFGFVLVVDRNSCTFFFGFAFTRR